MVALAPDLSSYSQHFLSLSSGGAACVCRVCTLLHPWYAYCQISQYAIIIDYSPSYINCIFIEVRQYQTTCAHIYILSLQASYRVAFILGHFIIGYEMTMQYILDHSLWFYLTIRIKRRRVLSNQPHCYYSQQGRWARIVNKI